MKRAAVITDISGLGNCSGAANISILSALGVEVCIIPTAILSAQTGFSDYFLCDLSSQIDNYINSLKKISPTFDLIYIGFLSNERQCKSAADFVRQFRRAETKVVVDPIIGDNGKRFDFITDELYSGVRSLAFSADIITPNITELCLLSGGDHTKLCSMKEHEQFEEISRLCRKILNDRLKTVIVTGADCGEDIANLTVSKDSFCAAKTKRYGGSMSGTGDIFTSIVSAAAAKGESIEQAVKQAAEFISEVMKRSLDTIEDRNYGIPYQEYLHLLIQ